MNKTILHDYYYFFLWGAGFLEETYGNFGLIFVQNGVQRGTLGSTKL